MSFPNDLLLQALCLSDSGVFDVFDKYPAQIHPWGVIIFPVASHNDARLNRKALPITDTELKLMAAAAIIGLNSNPKNG